MTHATPIITNGLVLDLSSLHTYAIHLSLAVCPMELVILHGQGLSLCLPP